MKRSVLHRLRSDERGSVIPLVGIGMVALMGMTALAVDIGRLYLERERLTNIADVAALSAAPYMLTDPDEARLVAQRYLEKNGLVGVPEEITVDESTKRVRVRVRNTIPMTFARVLGQEWGSTVGGAAANVAAISGVYGAAPLGVAQADWQIGDEVILKLSANDGSLAPGNYQALSLGKGGASMYEQNLMNGYQAWLRVGQWIETETGNMATPTVRAARYRIDLDPHTTYETVEKGSPRLLPIPVLQDWTVNGHGEVQVVGFAMFFLESVAETGSEKAEITGRFLRIVGEGEASGTAPNFGLVATKLVE